MRCWTTFQRQDTQTISPHSAFLDALLAMQISSVLVSVASSEGNALLRRPLLEDRFQKGYFCFLVVEIANESLALEHVEKSATLGTDCISVLGTHIDRGFTYLHHCTTIPVELSVVRARNSTSARFGFGWASKNEVNTVTAHAES